MLSVGFPPGYLVTEAIVLIIKNIERLVLALVRFCLRLQCFARHP